MAQETVVKNRKPPISELTPPAAEDGRANGVVLPRETPFSDVIGAFQDDPMLDAMLENIHQRRRELISGGVNSMQMPRSSKPVYLLDVDTLERIFRGDTRVVCSLLMPR